MNRWAVVTATAALVLAGCEQAPEEDDAAETQAAADTGVFADAVPLVRATTTLRDAAGAERGTATLTDAGNGVELYVLVLGGVPGEHGIHIHAAGSCDGASGFESAGSHLDPSGRAQHGLQNPAGPHMGDLPNLVVAADGTGPLTHTSTSVRMSDVLDADGAALVVHADPDDQRTDPSGNSGDRVLCGVLVRS